MVALHVVHASVWDLLDGITGVNAFDGQVPKTPPKDTDGDVGAYAVLYYSPGRRYASALNGAQASVDGTFQVTCAGADPTKTLWCVDQVMGALVGAAVLADGTQRRIRCQEIDPGPLRRDDDVTPVRFYAPLRFQLHTP